MQLGITGHRPQKLGKGFNDYFFHRHIKEHLLVKIQDLAPDVIYTGMALGVDQWTAEVAIKCGIPFVAALPFKNQDCKWSPKFRQHYQWLLSKAARVVLVDREPGYISQHALPDVYSSDKMMARNRWIVEQLNANDTLLAVCNDTNSGTWHTITTAYNANKALRILILRTSNLEWTRYETFLDDELPF